MRLFPKKQSKEVEPTFTPPAQKCQHKYQDFPWYLSYDISDYKYSISVIEPYVCIYCGERLNKVLSNYSGDTNGWKHLEKISNRFTNKIYPQEEVEDMINDMVLVDKEYLKWYHYLRDQKDPSVSRELEQDNKEIKLQL